MFHGRGMMRYISTGCGAKAGDSYEGDWQYGVMHGNGVYLYAPVSEQPEKEG